MLSGESDQRLNTFLNSLSHLEEQKLAKMLANRQRNRVKLEVQQMTSENNNIEALMKLDMHNYIDSKNKVMVSFLEGLLDDSDTKDQPVKIYSIGRTVEQMYKLTTWSSKTTPMQPLSLIANLCTYMDTSSKITLDCNGTIMPGGKYKSVCTWLNSQAAIGPPVAPEGDIAVAFDNNQVLGKRWQVSPLAKCQSSVITNKMFVQLEPQGLVETKDDLMPGQWFTVDKMKEFVSQNQDTELSEHRIKYEKSHYDQVFWFIDAAISDLTEELQEQEDPIQSLVLQRQGDRKRKKCVKCCMYSLKGKQKCSFCGTVFPKGSNPIEDLVEEQQDQPEATRAHVVKKFDPHKGSNNFRLHFRYGV